jgi:SAM-dependent methyltransferase
MAQIWKTEESNWMHRTHARSVFISHAKRFNGSFLEIGPGYGRVLKEIGQENPIIGLEIDSGLTELLTSRGYSVIEGVAERIPFKDSTFDVILCEEVLEHIANQKDVVEEVFRVLKTGGTAIFATPNKYIYRSLMFINNLLHLNFQDGFFKNPTPGHISELTGRQLFKLFDSRFEVELFPINVYIPEKILCRFPFLSINNIVICKKR